jgi:hypothetical protein
MTLLCAICLYIQPISLSLPHPPSFVSVIRDVVRFQVLTADCMKMAVFWFVTTCSLVEVYRRFRGTCCLHHQGVATTDLCVLGEYLIILSFVDVFFSPFGRMLGLYLQMCDCRLFPSHGLSNTAILQ